MAAIAAVLIHYCNTARTSPIGKGETAHQSVKSILFCALNPLQVMLSWLSLVEHLRLTDSSRLLLGFISPGEMLWHTEHLCIALTAAMQHGFHTKSRGAWLHLTALRKTTVAEEMRRQLLICRTSCTARHWARWAPPAAAWWWQGWRWSAKPASKWETWVNMAGGQRC